MDPMLVARIVVNSWEREFVHGNLCTVIWTLGVRVVMFTVGPFMRRRAGIVGFATLSTFWVDISIYVTVGVMS